VIRGESDQIAPEPYGRAYAASFPNGRFEPIPQAGHLPHLEQPEQVLQAIHRFADETTRSATTEPGSACPRVQASLNGRSESSAACRIGSR
jgi:hypothetical protein